MVAYIGCAGTILQYQAFIPAIIGFPHRGMNADVRGDSGENQMRNSARSQNQIKIRSEKKPPLPGLSTTISSGKGVSSVTIRQPGSSLTKIRPEGPTLPISAPALRLRHRLLSGKSERSGRCPSLVKTTVNSGMDRTTSSNLRIGSIVRAVKCGSYPIRST